MIVSSILKAMSEIDKRYVKKGKEQLVVGKDDKGIGLLDGDGKLNILHELPTLSIASGSNPDYGQLTMPTNLGNLEIKWGKQAVQADTSQLYPFHVPFSNRCLTIIGSQELNNPVTSLMIQGVSKDEFQVDVVGGTSKEVISWIAIGD